MKLRLIIAGLLLTASPLTVFAAEYRYDGKNIEREEFDQLYKIGESQIFFDGEKFYSPTDYGENLIEPKDLDFAAATGAVGKICGRKKEFSDGVIQIEAEFPRTYEVRKKSNFFDPKAKGGDGKNFAYEKVELKTEIRKKSCFISGDMAVKSGKNQRYFAVVLLEESGENFMRCRKLHPVNEEQFAEYINGGGKIYERREIAWEKNCDQCDGSGKIVNPEYNSRQLGSRKQIPCVQTSCNDGKVKIIQFQRVEFKL